MKRKLLTRLKVNEISSVDRGANPDALVTFFKQKQGDSDMDIEMLAKRLEELENVTKSQAVTIESLEKAKADLEGLAKMSDEYKGFMSTLSDEEKAKFIGMKDDERKAYMSSKTTNEKEDKADDVSKAYQEKLNVEIQKREALESEIAKIREEKEFEKFASSTIEIAPSLKSADKAELLKSLFKMDKNFRDSIIKEIGEADKAKTNFMKEHGVSTRGSDDPNTKLEILAKSIAKDKGITVEKGMAIALETVEGIELYNQSQKM